MRPRSCVGYGRLGDAQGILNEVDLNNAVKKRWSNLPVGSKLFQAFDKLASEDSEDYTDSLEHSPMKRAAAAAAAAQQNVPITLKPSTSPSRRLDNEEVVPGGIKFKKLQEKWELMIGKEENKEQTVARSPASPARTPTGAGKSKIPRLLASPTKQPVNAISPVAKCTKTPVTGIPSLKKASLTTLPKTVTKRPGDIRKDPPAGRTSRVDQEAGCTPRIHFARPSSLPYKQPQTATKEKNLSSPHRRAASTSLPRPNSFGRNATGGTAKPALK